MISKRHNLLHSKPTKIEREKNSERARPTPDLNMIAELKRKKLRIKEELAEISDRPTARKDHPLSMRLPDADIAIIDRAASLRGRSRTEFMRDAAVRTAEEVIMENTVIRMSPAGFAAFVDLLDRPARPVPEMVELLKRPAPWETQVAAE